MGTTLTLFFSDNFEDEAWRGVFHKLVAPTESNVGEWVLGRHPASHLTISIRNVSRKHAAITYSYAADRWSIQDLGSYKGTALNGKWLNPGDVRPLSIGDSIWLADNSIKVVEDEQDTIGDNEGIPTYLGMETLEQSMDVAAIAPPPTAPPSPKTWQDSLYLWAEWGISGSTVLGRIGRLFVLGIAAFFVVFLLSLFLD